MFFACKSFGQLQEAGLIVPLHTFAVCQSVNVLGC
jgi:hypothetical protein